jgi:murein L,D-transpeptidase YcbB/YkuD
MSQRQKINEANLKKAAAARAIEKDRLERGLTQAEIREKLFAPKVKLLESYQSVIDSKRQALAAIQNMPEHPQYKTLRAELAQAEAGMAKIQAMGIDAPELLAGSRSMAFSATDLPKRKAT